MRCSHLCELKCGVGGRGNEDSWDMVISCQGKGGLKTALLGWERGSGMYRSLVGYLLLGVWTWLMDFCLGLLTRRQINAMLIIAFLNYGDLGSLLPIHVGFGQHWHGIFICSVDLKILG